MKNICVYIYTLYTCIRPSKQNIPHFVFEKFQDDGQMQRVQIFQALPVLLLVLLTLASNFAKDGALVVGWVFSERFLFHDFYSTEN